MLKFALLFLIASSAFAQNYDYAGKFGLGAGLGANWPIFNNKLNDQADQHYLFDFHGRYNFTSSIGAELGFNRHEFYYTKSALQVFDLTLLYRVNPVDRFSWVLGAGLGAADFTKDGQNGYNIAAKLRAGFDYSYSQSLVASLVVDYQHVNKAFSESKLPVGNIHLIAPRFQLTWYFGKCDETSPSIAVTPTSSSPVAKSVPVSMNGNGDDDKDGVLNKSDKCPSTAAGAKVNAYGCAVDEKGTVKININFAPGKSIVESRYNNELKKLADFMKENPKVKVEVQGHTDNTGSKILNKKISEARAAAVALYLVQKFKIESGRVASKGFGDEYPVADNNTASGRTENRRVIAVISE